MSNPFKQIKQEAHLTQAEKSAMRSSLVFEMNKKVAPVKSSFVFPIKYFFSSVAVLAVVVLVVTNLGTQTSLPLVSENQAGDTSVALYDNLVHQEETPSKNIFATKTTPSIATKKSNTNYSTYYNNYEEDDDETTIVATTGGTNNQTYSSTNNSTGSTSGTASITGGATGRMAAAPMPQPAAATAPVIVTKLKTQYLGLIQNYTVCYYNNKITCRPDLIDANRPKLISNWYYYGINGNAFTNVEYDDAEDSDDPDEEIENAKFYKTFHETMSEAYECNAVINQFMAEYKTTTVLATLKQMIPNGNLGACKKLYF